VYGIQKRISGSKVMKEFTQNITKSGICVKYFTVKNLGEENLYKIKREIKSISDLDPLLSQQEIL
jgi:hypothetical protein